MNTELHSRPSPLRDITSSSTAGLITTASANTNDLHERLVQYLKAPHDAPCTLEVVRTLSGGLQLVMVLLEDPDPRIPALLRDLVGFRDSLIDTFESSHGSSPSRLDGKKTKNPVWVAFAGLEFSGCTNEAVLVLAACAFLRALEHEKPISESLAKDLAQLNTLDPLSKEQLHHLLWENVPEGDPPASVARIAGIEQPLFDQLRQRLDDWVAGVYRLHFPNKTRGVQSMPTLEKRLDAMRVDAGDCGTEFWSAFSRALDRAVSRDVMRAAMTCWEHHGRGVNIPLIPIAVGRPMLQLLLHAQLARGNIRTMVQSPPPSGKPGGLARGATSIPNQVPGDQTVIKTVTGLFIQELKFNPYLEAAMWRSERPMAYLRINPHAEANCTAPTAERTAGLRGWLVAIKARLLLDELGGGAC